MDGGRIKAPAKPTARLVPYEKRAIGIRWRCGKRAGEVSTETTDRDTAIGARALLLDRLARGIFPGAESEGPDITWPAFRERYKDEHVKTLSEGSQSAWTTSANWLESLCKPKRLAEVDKGMLSRFRGALLGKGLSPNSAATYLRTIRAGLGWAHEMGLLEVLPRVRARQGIKSNRSMRSRPITGEEFDRIIEATVEVRPKDCRDWQRFLRGLSHATLRVDELRRLSWDASADLSIDTSGKYPMIRMLAEGHKSRSDCFQPITPEFWVVLTQRGYSRTGYAFPLRGRNQQMTRKRVIKVISEIGKKAGVVTEPTTKKTATSHDIGRRAGLTRLAETLSTSQTQQFARHSDPRTTTQYYIRHEAESLAEAVGWKSVAKGVATPKQPPRRTAAKPAK
jgi:integrase